MVRVMAGLAAWVAGTAIAVCVAWLGANVVVRDAGVQSGLPVVNAAVAPPSAVPSLPSAAPPSAPSVSTPAAPPSGSASARATGGTPAAGTSSPAASSTGPATAPSTAGVHAYTLAGGRVTLDVTASSVQLVTAVPDAGDSVQTWSGTGWLRVDFSSGANVSSLIASWYEHAPTITLTNG
jgi:hypothetical protein